MLLYSNRKIMMFSVLFIIALGLGNINSVNADDLNIADTQIHYEDNSELAAFRNFKFEYRTDDRGILDHRLICKNNSGSLSGSIDDLKSCLSMNKVIRAKVNIEYVAYYKTSWTEKFGFRKGDKVDIVTDSYHTSGYADISVYVNDIKVAYARS